LPNFILIRFETTELYYLVLWNLKRI